MPAPPSPVLVVALRLARERCWLLGRISSARVATRAGPVPTEANKGEVPLDPPRATESRGRQGRPQTRMVFV